MGGFSWQQVVIFGWVLALLVGCVVAVRARRSWMTVVMLLGVSVGVVAVPAMIWFRIVWARSVAGGASFGGGPVGFERYQLLMNLSGGALLIGLVIFSVGFIGFCARYGAAERRAAELEGMVVVLQERLEEETR